MPTLGWVQTKKNKCLFSLRTILFLRLLFGQYFKLSSSPIICWIARLYCIISVSYDIGISYYSVSASESYIDIAFAFVLIFHIASNCLISFLTGEEDIIQISKNIHAKAISRYNIPLGSYVTYFLLILVVTLRYIALTIVFFTDTDIVVYFLYDHVFWTCFTSNLTSVYVADWHRRNVYCLKKTLQDNFKDADLSDSEGLAYVKDFIHGYIQIITSFSATWNFLRLRIILAFIFTWLNALYEISYEMLTSGWYFEELPWDCNVLAYVAITCMPLIVMELAANDLDEIKHLLADELLSDRGVELQRALHDALDYIEVCSNKFTMWNHFPLNITTALGFINLCIAYLIVILQFTY